MNKLTKRKLLIISFGLLLVNLLLAIVLFNLDNSTYENLDGTEVQPHSSELIKTVLLGLVISIPIVCFLIGLIVAIFIEKNVSYPQRIVKSFLLTLAVVYSLYALMGLIKITTY